MFVLGFCTGCILGTWKYNTIFKRKIWEEGEILNSNLKAIQASYNYGIPLKLLQLPTKLKKQEWKVELTVRSW
jgi:hypothetical protein